MQHYATNGHLRRVRASFAREIANGKLQAVLNELEIGFGNAYVAGAPVTVLHEWCRMGDDLSAAAVEQLGEADPLRDSINGFIQRMSRCVRQEQRMPSDRMLRQPGYSCVLSKLIDAPASARTLAKSLNMGPDALGNKLTMLMGAHLISKTDEGLYCCLPRGINALENMAMRRQVEFVR